MTIINVWKVVVITSIRFHLAWIRTQFPTPRHFPMATTKKEQTSIIPMLQARPASNRPRLEPRSVDSGPPIRNTYPRAHSEGVGALAAVHTHDEHS